MLKFFILFLLGGVFTIISRLILSKFNIAEKRKETISWVIGFVLAIVSYTLYTENGSISTSNDDITISNFKIDTAYKVSSPPFLSSESSEPQLEQFVIIYSMDVTNNSGNPIINYDGLTPDGEKVSSGRFSSYFFLENFNEMGDYKDLATGDIYLFDGGNPVQEFSDENPFPDKKTYKLYGYLDLMGSAKGSTGDSKFIDYFNSEIKFEPQLEVRLVGSIPDDRTKYYLKKLDGVDVSNIREIVKRYQQDPNILHLIFDKKGPYNETILTNNPWKNNMSTNNGVTELKEPYNVICRLFNLKP